MKKPIPRPTCEVAVRLQHVLPQRLRGGTPRRVLQPQHQLALQVPALALDGRHRGGPVQHGGGHGRGGRVGRGVRV